MGQILLLKHTWRPPSQERAAREADQKKAAAQEDPFAPPPAPARHEVSAACVPAEPVALLPLVLFLLALAATLPNQRHTKTRRTHVHYMPPGLPACA